MQTWIVVPKVGEPFVVRTDGKHASLSLVPGREYGPEPYYKIGYAEVAVARS